MSVTTKSDEHINAAKEAIVIAKRELINAIDEDTWGYDELSELTITKISAIIHELAILKLKL